MQYFIKKEIEAKSVLEAIKRESKAEIIEVWTEPVKHGELRSAIGFEIETDLPLSGSEARR